MKSVTVKNKALSVFWLMFILAFGFNAETLSAAESILDQSESNSGPKPKPMVFLPADDAAHLDQVTEWWYWTGHFTTQRTKSTYGFEAVVFSNPWTGPAGWIQEAHFAITDEMGKKFHFIYHILEELPDLIANGFKFDLKDFHIAGGNGQDKIEASVDKLHAVLSLTEPTKSVFHFDGIGFADFPADIGGYHFYYSREDLQVTGTLNGEPVLGNAWFDHEYGDHTGATNFRWAWFSLRLDNGRRIMVYRLNTPSGTAVSGADSYNSVTRKRHEIKPEDISIAEGRTWTSLKSGRTYPSEWELTLEGTTYSIKSLLDKQELNIGPPMFYAYLEADCEIFAANGTRIGRAYVEY